MTDVCLNKNTVYRLNLFYKRTSSMRSRKSDIVGRETTNFSFTTSSAGYEADLVFGKRLHHPSLSGVAFLIFLIIFNIITFPITAVLNALVMVTTKSATGVSGFDRLYCRDSSSRCLRRDVNQVVT